LSPYLTHGFLSLAEVYHSVNAQHGLSTQHKLVFELGWRAYYRHVWAHLGDGIGQSIHAGLLPDSAYLPEVPTDVLEARTGIAAIDMAVRELYDTGYVHNHARMWLASYLVHLRKVHWHAGAQWMLGHLLDGDLASNHLSWQWVAGTGSSKAYLFNADNVAKYAPAPWHSPNTGIDISYEAMDALAHRAKPIYTEHDARRAGTGVAPPELFTSPAASVSGSKTVDTRWCVLDGANLPDMQDGPPAPGVRAHLVAGRKVWLHHPWSLGPGPTTLPADVLHIAVGIDTCHTDTPWSQRRWDFVTQGLNAQADPLLPLWWGSAESVACALQSARSVHWQPDPHVDSAFARLQAQLRQRNPHQVTGPQPAPCLFEPVTSYCRSFSVWWRQTHVATANTSD
jgi:deoxyribodipyrimidine photo-lyase